MSIQIFNPELHKVTKQYDSTKPFKDQFTTSKKLDCLLLNVLTYIKVQDYSPDPCIRTQEISVLYKTKIGDVRFIITKFIPEGETIPNALTEKEKRTFVNIVGFNMHIHPDILYQTIPISKVDEVYRLIL